MRKIQFRSSFKFLFSFHSIKAFNTSNDSVIDLNKGCGGDIAQDVYCCSF